MCASDTDGHAGEPGTDGWGLDVATRLVRAAHAIHGTNPLAGGEFLGELQARSR